MTAEGPRPLTPADRIIIETACKTIAETLIKRDLFRNEWRVDVDGCIFKFSISGYPKQGSEADARRKEYLARLDREVVEPFMKIVKGNADG
jgi:hypothetical protein